MIMNFILNYEFEKLSYCVYDYGSYDKQIGCLLPFLCVNRINARLFDLLSNAEINFEHLFFLAPNV